MLTSSQACGICPLDRNRVLQKLPSRTRDQGTSMASSALSDSVMSLLEDNLMPKSKDDAKKRGLKVSTGTAVHVAALSQPSTSGVNNPEKPQPKK